MISSVHSLQGKFPVSVLQFSVGRSKVRVFGKCSVDIKMLKCQAGRETQCRCCERCLLCEKEGSSQGKEKKGGRRSVVPVRTCRA